jgi:S-DNA-T family DNA segregation ATPase FtsK/SpoIIIE
VDLVRDGPHCLVGGTTGSGKSELLRTLVAGLAVSADPDHLTFVLIDYKGGASFDECSRLPHAVGLVTDLDAQLGERALRCLEAELRYRERLLREAGALDLPDYLRRQARARGGAAGGGLERPLPRLVVVIDEFATMVKELPDFIDSLVGIAQRGRSLGVHLILATQKPSGAVNDNIRTNTRLRIALRVEDKQDSLDVIDVPDAAAIVRRGRACVRRGPGDVALIQTALVTGVSGDESTARVDVAPFRFGPTARPPAPPRSADPSRRSDLGRLVDAVGAAFAALGADPPRRPWPEPLPTHLDLDTVCPRQPAAATASLPATVPFALADDPEAQDQYPRGWEPGRGNMLVYGVVGSGATTTLAAIAMVLARTCSADRVHLHVLDFGAGELQPLARLPHTGAVVGATERERQMRLVQYLRTELDRRKELRGPARSDEPALVVLIDNYGAFTADFEAAAGNEVLEAFMRVYADGPEVGIHMVVSADRTGAVPGALTTLTQQKLLLRLSDPNDYGVFGVRPRQVPAFHPGRGVLAETAQVLQVARPVPGLAEAVDDVATWQPRPARPPVAIGVLPDDVSVVDLVGRAQIDGTRWFVPVGVGESDLATAGLTFYEGDHALVAGPARSGKSTVLVSLARVVKSSSPEVMTIGVALRRSPLRDSPDLDRLVTTPAELAEALQGVDGDHRPQLILIDDADSVDDENGALASLLARGRPDVHIVASGRSDALRSLYGHWIQIIGRSRLGLLLRPDPDLDGTLLSTNLPRRQRVAPRAGRGYLVDSSGRVELVQAART